MDRQGSVATLRRAVAELARAHLPEEGRWCVALSGGADSLALTAVAAGLRPTTALIVDHGLQLGSADVAAIAREHALRLGCVDAQVLCVDVDAASGLGPEAAAREARYAVLEQVAEHLEARLVLLGHTADDQAETVLLGLGRGSGARSIAGMRAADRGYLRPLLGLRRADTEAACTALGVPVWQDPHNSDPRFRRVRLRTEVLPLLEDVLAGGVAEALARTASQLQEDLDALGLLADRILAEAHLSDGLHVSALHGQPAAITSRVLKSWAEDGGAGPLTAEHVRQLTRLINDWRGQDGIDLPGGYRARRASGRLVMTLPDAGRNARGHRRS